MAALTTVSCQHSSHQYIPRPSDSLYTYSYSNLIIPQEDVTEIDVTIGGKDGISLEKGKVTSIGLIVGREQLDLEGTTYPEDGEAMEEEKPSGVIPT